MIYFVITIASLLVGYWLGRSNRPIEELKKGGTLTLKKIGELYQSAIKAEIPTGVIKPKTAADIMLKNDPKKAAGLKAMKETLDNIPELHDLNEKVKRYKKMGLLE